jgi:uncharacterized membrane protein YhaH (DUF805 family)
MERDSTLFYCAWIFLFISAVSGWLCFINGCNLDIAFICHCGFFILFLVALFNDATQDWGKDPKYDEVSDHFDEFDC